MRRKYYVRYWNSFANTYDLAYADTAQEEAQAREDGWDQITRREAERLCRAERYRRKADQAFSGYAPTVILPISYRDDGLDWSNDHSLVLEGFVVERIKQRTVPPISARP